MPPEVTAAPNGCPENPRVSWHHPLHRLLPLPFKSGLYNFRVTTG